MPPRLTPLLCGLVLAAPASAEPGRTHQIPYRLTDTQHVMVRAKLNGKGPYNFIMDTGAPAVILAEEVGKELGLRAGEDGFSRFDSFKVEGGLDVPGAKALVLDMFQLKGMNGMGLPGVKLHGVIGYDLLARYRIEYDFTRDKMAWTELDFDPPAIARVGKRGASQGGLEAVGSVMGFLGSVMGRGDAAPPPPRGRLGVEVKAEGGVVTVTRVEPGSPADQSGLAPGDVIERIARGKRGKTVRTLVEDVEGLLKAAAETPAGGELSLKVSRAGESREVTVALGEGF